MKRLQRPLSRHLDPEVDEAALARVWARRRPVRRRRSGLVVGMLIGASLVVLAVVLRAGLFAPDAVSSPPVAALEARNAPETATLPDESTLVLAPGARVEPLAFDDARVLLHQLRGRVEYRVAPDATRRFVVEAGAVSVEVTGTRFVVDRDVDPVDVRVSEGSVVVRGDALPDHVVRLGPGDSLRSFLALDAGVAAAAVPGALPVDLPAASVESVETPPSPARPAQRDAVDAPAAEPVDPVAGWLAEADAARRGGRFREAVAPLEQVSRRGGPRGALASYSLGRLQMEELDDPTAAARSIRRALDLGLPTNLQEPARYRRFRALLHTDVLGASDAADDYLAAHPDGPHAEEVRWLAQ